MDTVRSSLPDFGPIKKDPAIPDVGVKIKNLVLVDHVTGEVKHVVQDGEVKHVVRDPADRGFVGSLREAMGQPELPPIIDGEVVEDFPGFGGQHRNYQPRHARPDPVVPCTCGRPSGATADHTPHCYREITAQGGPAGAKRSADHEGRHRRD